MSNTTPGNFARTFKDGEKVFILQLGSNAHSSFLMISELIHGRRKGFLVVPEGKSGSGWRGFGFHLWKAIAFGSLAIKQPFSSVLKPIVENSKSFMLAVTEGDRREGSGSRKGKQLMSNFQISTKSNLSNQSLDMRDLNVGKKQAMSKAKLSVEITKSISGVNGSLLTLDVGLRLERGLDGGWEVKWSKVQEVGRIEKPKDNNNMPEDKTIFLNPKLPSMQSPKLIPSPSQSSGPNQNNHFQMARPRTQETCLQL